MTRGKTITTYFINGNPKGIKSIFMPNRTCQCLVVPYNEEQMKNAKKCNELYTPSLYLLLTNEDKIAYIGECESFNDRYKYYDDEKKWTEAIVFVATDQSINKTNIKFLEHLAITQAKKANLFKLDNKITPTEPHMKDHLHDSTKDFFDDVQMLSSFLGYAIFEISHVPENKYLYIIDNHTNAKGVYENGEVRVFAGSTMRKNSTKSYKESDKRQKLLSENASEKEGVCELHKDILFKSPSAAARFCRGAHANGLTTWKNKQDKTLKEIENL